VTYASKGRGGIGIIDLETEQGMAHISYIIGSIRCSEATRTPILALLESYVLATGILGNPLTQCNYIKSPWMDTTQQMHQKINATIEIPAMKTITRHGIRERGLMSIATKYTNDQKKLVAINNCRIYLQVTTLAEITNVEGRKIHKVAYDGTYDNTAIPLIHKFSVSTLTWPNQDIPPKQAWKIWQKWLRTLTKKNCLELKHPLSRWLVAETTQDVG
jgi:hypothetical protein